jgi:hypothetical protein
MFDEPLHSDASLPRRSHRHSQGDTAAAETELFGALLDTHGLLTTVGTAKLLTTVVNLGEKVRVQQERHNDLLADFTILRDSVDDKVGNLLRKLDNLSTTFSDELKISRDRFQASVDGMRDEVAAIGTAISSLETSTKTPAASAPKLSPPIVHVKNPIFLPANTKCIVFGDSNCRGLRPMCKHFNCPTQVVSSAGLYDAMHDVARVTGSRESKLDPLVLFFSCVTNEIPGKFSDAWYQDRITELQDVCGKHFPGATAYFLTPPPRNDTPDRTAHTEAVRKMLMSISDKPKFSFLDLSLEFERVGTSALLASDGIHLTQDGVFAVAEKIDFLISLLTKQRSLRERFVESSGPDVYRQPQTHEYENDSGYGRGFSRMRRPFRGRPTGRFSRGRPPYIGSSHAATHYQHGYYGGPPYNSWFNQYSRGGHFGPPTGQPVTGAFSFASRQPNPNYRGGYSDGFM